MSQNDLNTQDESLIHDEVARYEKTHARVAAAFKEKIESLDDDEKLARRLTAEVVATQRDEEKQALQSDESVAHSLAKIRLHQSNDLSDLVQQPYFARVVYQEGARRGEFRLGVASFPEERIIDWRKSPISKLYYDYDEGADYDDEIAGVERQGQVLVKRGFRGERETLLQIETKDLSYVQRKGVWSKFKRESSAPFSLDDKKRIQELLSVQDPAAWEALASGDGYLSQILSLLTPEQFRLISAASRQPVIIQGSAGTGKTTVALHRLSWLLFEGNSTAKAENVLVVMYSHTLAEYVKNILPSLGVHGVIIATYQDWRLHPDRYPASLDYLVVDEAQDFSVAELQKLTDCLVDKNNLILAGDLGQKISGAVSFQTWHEVLLALGYAGVDVLNLSIAYRSTYQIYEIAEFVRDPNTDDDDLKLTPKFGPDPLLTRCHGDDEAASLTKKWIEDVITHNQKINGAILCRTPDDAKKLFTRLAKMGTRGIRLGTAGHFEFAPGIVVTDVREAKGLEFHAVLIYEPSEVNYPTADAMLRNLLYVALTRAIFRLDFMAIEQPTAMLPEFLNTLDLTVLEKENEELRERYLFDGIEMKDENPEEPELDEESGE